ASLLPQVRNSSEKYGEACTEFLTEGCIPIAGIAGDQQAALFGQTCFTPGMVKNTYGTGCFMLMNTGNKRVFSKNGLVSTLAWGMENKVTYALEGSVFIAGAAVKWLRDGLKIIQSAKETEELALSVNDTEGVYVIPAFSGLGAPYWDMAAKGAILGLSQGTSVKHLVRATLEALAYQTRDVIEAMKNDCNLEIPELQVDGGASVNNFLMQFQADILNLPVRRPDIIESTAFGAAMLAALSTGFWSMDEIVTNRRVDRTFAPHMTEPERNRKYEGWKEALRRILS
ncbi:MAG: glycerol kinase, partial [Bacteroidia bacterium]|nr:glycerol kinase [Bacteroidia bacterium]